MRKKIVDLCLEVRRQRRLWTAWRHVYQNGITSKSRDTRTEVKSFQGEAERQMRNIASRLQKKTFSFPPAQGIPQKRRDKTPRPIVHAPVEARVVQRSILDVLQGLPAVEPLFAVDTSFGGIKDRGVRQALQVAYDELSSGAQFYVRSDIESFFTKIPKSQVLEQIAAVVSDQDFIQLLREGLDLELSNLDDLGANAVLFPVHEIGVAQGCCLSPLIGNVLLAEFDQHMNGCGILCLRYIDDFLILGLTESKVRRAFQSAQTLLAKHGLRAYDPNEDSGKADAGMVCNGFEFLGCDVRPGMITPNKKSRERLLKSVSTVLKTSAAAMNGPKKLVAERRTVIDTLSEVSNILQGWGNQYSYCNNGQVLRMLDEKIDLKIKSYLSTYKKVRRRLNLSGNHEDTQRLLGIHLLSDSKSDPIVHS